MPPWYFKPLEPGGSNREPIHGEFFAADAISEPGVALVREGIQNALDAARDGETVTVSIYLPDESEAPDASVVSEFFRGLWPHIGAAGNGLLPHDVPEQADPCRFLVFEDFGTTGLTGDPTEAFRPRDDRENHFYYFFRAEGQSDKDASSRGSWGVGKHVFMRASTISTMFALTVRADDGQRMLMGKSVLKSHYVVEGECCQNGYLGVPPDDDQPLVMPLTDDKVLDEFSTIFDLQRGSDPGLSLVILWPDSDITESAIKGAVLGDYFYPILAKQLQVLVETPNFETMLDANTLLTEVETLDGESELTPIIELAAWARGQPEITYHTLRMPDPSRAWRWTKDLIPSELLDEMQESFATGEKIAIRVPVTVKPREAPPQESHFDIFLQRDADGGKGRPTFIREGIIVTKVNSPQTRGVRALVIAEDLPLAAFLRAAENPSHTEWHHKNLKAQYKHGYAKDLEFVKRAVHEIVRLVTKTEREEDPILLVDLFSIPAPPDEDDEPTKPKTRPTPKPGEEPPDVPELPAPRLRSFRIQRVAGGFGIHPGDPAADAPEALEIRVAYDTRRGNPIRRHDPADFEFGQLPLQFSPAPEGTKLVECDGNRILLAITNPEFHFHVTGFDERRQLYVKVETRELPVGHS